MLGAARGAGLLLVALLSAVVLLPVGTPAAAAEVPSVSSAGPAAAAVSSAAQASSSAARVGWAPLAASSAARVGWAPLAASSGSLTAAPVPSAPVPSAPVPSAVVPSAQVPSARGLPGARSSRDLGLAVLLAAVLLAGVASLLVRVLLAEPRHPVPGAALSAGVRRDRPVPGPELSDPAARL